MKKYKIQEKNINCYIKFEVVQLFVVTTALVTTYSYYFDIAESIFIFTIVSLLTALRVLRWQNNLLRPRLAEENGNLGDHLDRCRYIKFYNRTLYFFIQKLDLLLKQQLMQLFRRKCDDFEIYFSQTYYFVYHCIFIYTYIKVYCDS